MRFDEINVNELTEALIHLNGPKRILLILASWLVLAGAGFFLYWQSDLQRAQQLESDIELALGRLDKQSQLLLERPAIEEELMQLQTKLPLLKKALPTERELASLLDRINDMIVAHNILLADFTPEPSQNLEVMRVVPVKLSLKSNGLSIARLPNYIASLSRQVSLKQFEMSVIPESGLWQMTGQLHAFAQLPSNVSKEPATP